MRPARFIRLPLALATALLAPLGHADPAPAAIEVLPKVELVSPMPLPGSTLPLSKIPANVQTFTSGQWGPQGTDSLTAFLAANATGLNLNAVQGNANQVDLNVRGFTASPLLGTPQGISVFLDGVRMNELFGDVVNWDLIPSSAIAGIQLIPGSSPVHGMNTLGGALALVTKRGASEYPDHPGASITASGGSFGRRSYGAEFGGRQGRWDWFVTGAHTRETGWAEHNASELRQVFGKLGYQDTTRELTLSLQWADNHLEGTQTLPRSFSDIRQAYTWPDLNRNHLFGLALHGSQALGEAWRLSGNVYHRSFRNRNVSSNANDSQDDEDAPPAVNDASVVTQTSRGGSVQLAYAGKLAAMPHHLSIGLGLDDGHARFTRTSQPAAFTSDRGTTPLGPFEAETDSDSDTRYSGAYASSSLDLGPVWTLTLAGRFNLATVSIRDRSGTAPELNGSHRFTRFNPSIGVNFNPRPGLTAYASYNQGMRAPTAMELTCADPAAPCKLPNAFISDPPLRKVVSSTFELGARGKPSASTDWRIALFRSDLRDDIQFVSGDGLAVNAGYFQNIGSTRRQGLELDAGLRAAPLVLNLHYTYLDAHYVSGFLESSPSNSTADANGAINVKPGDRIPGLPRHTLKLRAEHSPLPGWTLGLNLVTSSAVRARGDENNADVNGRIGGYSLINLDGRYAPSPRLNLFARIDNVLDRRYANFGVLGMNVFTGPGASWDAANARAEQFRGHGAPRGLWAGLQYSID